MAANDAASVAEDSASGVLIDVRTNDSKGPANESGQTLTIDSVVTQPTHGTAVIVSGQIRYTPTEDDYFGPRLLHLQGVRQRDDQRRGRSQVRHSDGQRDGHSGQRPAEGERDSASVAEDSSTGVLVDVKANDSVGPANESGQTLTITGVTQGAHGSVAVEAGKVRLHPDRGRLLRVRLLHLHDPGQRAERRSAGQRLQERHRDGQRDGHSGQRPAEGERGLGVGGRGRLDRRTRRCQGE